MDYCYESDLCGIVIDGSLAKAIIIIYYQVVVLILIVAFHCFFG